MSTGATQVREPKYRVCVRACIWGGGGYARLCHKCYQKLGETEGVFTLIIIPCRHRPSLFLWVTRSQPRGAAFRHVDETPCLTVWVDETVVSHRDGHAQIWNTGGLSKGLTSASGNSQQNSIYKFKYMFIWKAQQNDVWVVFTKDIL